LVIALFLEGIPAGFAAAAERADRAGKPIVALKAGSSEVGSAAALAHTGSVAGNDAVVDAALRQLNVIRVTSIEELLSTAAVLGYSRWPRGRRMGAVTTSGGACDIIADRASAEGIELPAFSGPTAAAITELLPPFAEARNPLDVTGYFLANRRTSSLTPVDAALEQAVADPGLDFVLYSGVSVPDGQPEEAVAKVLEERVAWLAGQLESAPIPVIATTSTCVDLSDYGRELLGRHGVHLLGGIDLAIRATGHSLRWLNGRGRFVSAPFAAQHAVTPTSRTGPWPESEARDLLTAFGINPIQTFRVKDLRGALDAAHELGYPVVLKISSAEVTHKSEVGGVALDLRTDADVTTAFQRLVELTEEVTVSPMRTGGVELLAGVTVDPTFGPVLAVGLGGIWVEVLNDVSLRVLPVDHDEVRRMLAELRGYPLLTGARGQIQADLDALADVIVRIGSAACSLGPALGSFEINPLWVNGGQIEALDILVLSSVQTD
jgi:acetate---CoA ligase (ADP-forming)